MASLVGCHGRPGLPLHVPQDAASTEATPADGPQDRPRTDNRPGDVPIGLPPDAPPPDAPPPDGPPSDKSELPPDAPPDAPPPDAPPAAYLHLVEGPMILIGYDGDSCSTGSPGDIWCGVIVPGAGLGSSELWVVDVDKAGASGPTTLSACEAAGSCKLLHKNLWHDTSSGANNVSPYVHRFEGDTLIFSADATSGAGERFAGRVLAWRPGWAAPRSITGAAGYQCYPTPRADNAGPYAYCYENIDSSSSPELKFDWTAGRVSEGGAPLPKQDSSICCEVGGVTKQSARFSPDNKWFVWSGRAAVADKETFWYKAADALDASPARTKLFDDGSSRVGFTGDGKRFFYLRKFDHAPMDPRGELVADAFPPTGMPTSVNAAVTWARPVDDGTVTDRGLYYLAGVAAGKGDLHMMRDSTSTSTDKLLAGGVCKVFEVAKSLDGILYAQNCDASSGHSDLYLLKIDPMTGGKLGNCSLTTAPQASLFAIKSFTDDGQWVYWATNIDTSVYVGDGMLTRSTTCSASKVASAVWSWEWLADDRVAWGQDSDGTTASLRLTTPAFPPGPSTSVQLGADITFSATRPSHRSLVYTVSKGVAGAQGLWVFAL